MPARAGYNRTIAARRGRPWDGLMATDSVWKWSFLLALLLVVAGVSLLRHRSGCPFRNGQVLGSALIFGLLGPPLGGLLLGLVVLVIEFGSRGNGLLLF